MAPGAFTLYLVRHGRAAERGDEWPDDGKRPLTPQGIDRFQQVVRGLSVLGVTIDIVLTSPLVRARQTADLLAGGLRPHPSVEVTDVLAPGAPVADVMAALAQARRAKSIACVGHEPDLGAACGAPDRCPPRPSAQEGRHLPNRHGRIAHRRRTRLVRTAPTAAPIRALSLRCALPSSSILCRASRSAGMRDVAVPSRRWTSSSAVASVPKCSSRNAPGHLFELARGAVERGATRVIAWGGDGSVNEVSRRSRVHGDADGNRPCRIWKRARSRVGRAHAQHRGAPRRALREPHPIDLGEIDGHVFVNIAGVGFDAHVAHAFNSGRRGTRPAGIRATGHARALRVRASAIQVASGSGGDAPNAPFCSQSPTGRSGGTARTIAPDARLDDGLLDIVIAGRRRRLRRAATCPGSSRAPSRGPRASSRVAAGTVTIEGDGRCVCTWTAKRSRASAAN